MPILLSSLFLAPAAHAAEVQFEGYYRARFRAFDTLSLDRDNALDEGLSALAQHRLWLAPRFLITDQASLFVQINALNGVPWGMSDADYAGYGLDPANVFEYDLTSPTSSTDPNAPLLDLTLWRAWGEVYTPIGQFSFGRMPLGWGRGIWLNDGLSDPLNADFGDTTDRVMWEHLIQDQFYLRASVDVPAERFVGADDDTTAVGFGVAYKNETMSAGILLQLDHTGPQQPAGAPLDVFTADAAGDVTLGKLNLAAEAVGQFGGGNLEGGYNDANITAVGAVLEAGIDLEPWGADLQVGIASGDNTPGDLNLRTFTFDRDYSVGMFLFEQPMPTLATSLSAANDTNGGRDYGSVLSGAALSNAIFVKPTGSREIVDGLRVDVSWLGARVARPPTIDGVNQSRGYGNEFQLGVSYTGIAHVLADARFGLFLPGTHYSRSANGEEDTGFDGPAYGFQLTGRIDF
ncbi:MAG: hypothetical protein ABMA64_01860 [Myxococcota bacterium]